MATHLRLAYAIQLFTCITPQGHTLHNGAIVPYGHLATNYYAKRVRHSHSNTYFST